MVTCENSPRSGRRRLKLILFSLLPALLLLALAEAGLRLAGFSYSSRLEYRTELVDGHNRLVEARDPNRRDLYYRLVPDGETPFVPAHEPPFNAFGFRGDVEQVARTPGVKRLAAIGCSCTMQGDPSYLEVASNRLNDSGPRRYEVLNAAVGSYSSEFGLRGLKSRVLPFQPDYLTVLFGWNDHWAATFNGAADKEFPVRGPGTVAFLTLLSGSRVVQGMYYLGRRWRSAPTSDGEAVLRVAPDDYRANHRAIVELCRARGIQPVFLTSPSGLDPANEMQMRSYAPIFFNRPEAIPAIHAAYNAIVREVAAEQQVPLLDLEREFAVLPAADRAGLFRSDGIHFTQPGLNFIGARLAATLAPLN